MSKDYSKELKRLKNEIIYEFEDEIKKLSYSVESGANAVSGGSQDDRLDEYIDLLTELFLERIYSGDLLIKGSFISDFATSGRNETLQKNKIDKYL